MAKLETVQKLNPQWGPWGQSIFVDVVMQNLSATQALAGHPLLPFERQRSRILGRQSGPFTPWIIFSDQSHPSCRKWLSFAHSCVTTVYPGHQNRRRTTRFMHGLRNLVSKLLQYRNCLIWVLLYTRINICVGRFLLEEKTQK